MNFGFPAAFWLALVLVPALIAFLWWSWRIKQRLLGEFIGRRLLQTLLVDVSPARQKARLVLLVGAVAGALLALARPQWGFVWEEAKQRGLDIVVAIDTSRSMLAEDIQPNRLERAKLETLGLLNRARTDRFALVAFAGTAFLQCPLTLDDEAFRQSVLELHAGIIPLGGSLLSEAIRVAMTAFTGDTDNHKILVLFSDGEDHESGALEAARAAAQAGLRIFTIGVGTPEGELLRVPDESGALNFVKDPAGNVIKSRLNETLLREMATAAGGFYLHLRGADTMDTLYERGLAPLPKGEISAKFIKRFHERFYWPLGLAIGLLLLETFLPVRRRVKRAEEDMMAAVDNHAGRKAVAALVILVLVPWAAPASPSSAQRDFKRGQYEPALREYERLLARKPDDPRLRYNAGAAAYEAGRFDQALTNFSAALTAPDVSLQQRAFYNLGNTLFRLGEAAREPNATRQHWERALKSYEGAYGLDPRDEDAKFNYEFVKRKLEELQAQQQQPQQSQGGDSQNQQSRQSSSNQQSAAPKQDPQDQPGQPQAGADQQDSRPQPGQRPGDQQAEQRRPDEKPGQPGEEQKQADAQPEQRGQPERGGDPASDSTASAMVVPLGQMTLQQAMQLLDAQRGDERTLIFGPLNLQTNAAQRPIKDW